MNAKPFLKWAGGKRELLPRLDPLLPQVIQTYYEPFLGGGALYFHLANKGAFQKAVVNDLNSELTNCYQVIQEDLEGLTEQLQGLAINKEKFLEIRALNPKDLSPVEGAARTIYLNRTCFNGLYRVNKAGQFNVPWGKYKNPKVLNRENLQACHEMLNKDTSIHCGSYLDIVISAEPGDVVYFDPPYVPLTTTSNFRSYTKEGFTLEDQKRLARCFAELVARGVTVIASNSDTEVVRNLYAGFEQHTIPVRRNINSKGDKRGPVNELVIVGIRHLINQT